MALTTGFKGYYRAKSAIIGNNLVVGNGSTFGVSYVTPAGGTTSNYLLNGSTGVFNLPPGANIIFAELVIAAAGFGSPLTTFDFTTPAVATSLPYGTLATDFWQAYYQDVTTLVKNGGSGTYQVGRVNGDVLSTMWFVYIVYEDPSYDLNYIIYDRGCVAPFSTLTLNNVFTPKSGPIKGIMLKGLTGSDNADAGTTRINGTYIGNTSNPWDGLSPYNRRTNIEPGIICVANPSEPNFGLLDTRGTFGNANNNPYTGVSPNPNRTWGDITGIDISSTLTNGLSTVTLQDTYSGGWFTNIIAFQISAELAVLEIAKTVNKNIAVVGDIIEYTLVIENTGNIPTTNFSLVDTLPSNLAFVANSLYVDGVQKPGSTIVPPNGYNYGSIPALAVSTITFNAMVVNATTTVANNAASAIYLTNSTGFTVLSNTVTTQIFPNPLTVNKTVDKTYAAKGEIVQYTLQVHNSGTIPISNVSIIDTIPNQTSFVSNSLIVNGVSQVGTVEPPSGFNLGTILGNTTIPISFQIDLSNVTTNFTLTNNGYAAGSYLGSNVSYQSGNVVTTIVYGSIQTIKSVDKNFAAVGATVTYTVGLVNIGNTTLTNIKFIDTIPSGLTLVTNSLKQDGVAVSGTPNYPGVTLPNSLAINGTSTIVYQVVINTIPSIDPIINIANLEFNYTVNPTIPNGRTGASVSNQVQTKVNQFYVGQFTKFVDKVYTTPGDVITYTIVISNIGNINGNDLRFVDTIPNGTTFISNSVEINGIVQSGSNPIVGVNIGSIIPGEVKTITFKVSVN